MRQIGHLAVMAFLFGLWPATASAWWNTAWGLRRKLTFNNTGQPSNLTNFAVLVKLDSTRVEYFRTQNSGQDIRFVDADDTTLLDHEIELWNEAGTSYVWVRVPQVNGASNTDYIWMYYDNPAAADGQNVAGVWDTNYKMVQHLRETAGAHQDSTSNNNDSVSVLVTTQGSAAGQIDGADLFVPANHVDVADSATLDVAAGESLTVEAWVKSSSASNFMVAVSKEEDNISEYQLWVNTGNASFWMNDGPGGTDFARADCATNVRDGNWHYLVGRWDRPSSTAEIFVDGISRGTATNATIGAISSANPLVIGEEGDANRGGNFDGTLDEVRVAKVSRSNDDIRAQFLSMSDTFVTYGPAACLTCTGLTTVEGGSGQTYTVTAPGNFELTFDTFFGGGFHTFYDLREDPGKAFDLAGNDGSGIKTLHHFGFLSGSFYDTEDNTANTGSAQWVGSPPKLDLLEATPTRVKVRHEAFFQQSGGNGILPMKGYGDYTVYPAGKSAYRFNRRTTAMVPFTDEDLAMGVITECPFSGAACSDLTAYSQTGVIPAPEPAGNPAGDDFLLAQREVTGRRTDFLNILSTDWALANRVGYDNTVSFLTWRDTPTVSPLAAGNSQTWNFLTYFKPTNFTSHTDPAVTGRSADYRTPDILSVIAGTGWFDPSENTSSPNDFFNEAEGAYDLTLDPVNGLNFSINGGATFRFNPVFKMRQWRSLAPPGTMTLGGTTLTLDVGYKADVKPFARAYFVKDVRWRSTLESSAAVTAPEIGSAGTVNGPTTFAAARYGNGMNSSATTRYSTFPSAPSNFDKAEGAVEFWYQPTYAHTDGIRHVLWQNFGSATQLFTLEKTNGAGGNQLQFSITNGGTVTTVAVTSANYSWRASDWVHLRVTWNSAAVLNDQVHIFFNGVEPPHVSSGGLYNQATMAVATNYIGIDNATSASANGLIDEFNCYGGAGFSATPQKIATGGLAGTTEFLADGTKNFQFALAGVNALKQGSFLFFGSDSQFHGLNAFFTTFGTGVLAGDLVWEYWNGTAWTSLESVAGFTDATNSFAKNGSVSWTGDPASWSVYSLIGGPDLYYVRVYLPAGANYTTAPRESVIKTDILVVQYCGDVTTNPFGMSVSAPITTEVTLQSFTASAADEAVDLSWTTASELQNLGFHLYRADSAEGPYTRMTSSLIAGLGSSATGRSYSYRDAGLTNGRTYYYELEDVETTGRTERHGPVSATPHPASGGSPPTPGSGAPPSGGTSYGDPTSVGLRELERSATHVLLELRTGGFFASPAEDGRVRLSVPGFESLSDVGEPSLPMRRAFVEAMAGRKVRLSSVQASDEVRFAGLRPVSQGVPSIEVDENGVVLPSQEKRREGRAFKGVFPTELALLLGTSFQGEHKKAEVRFSPLRWDGSGLVLSRRLVVRLDFVGTETKETSRGGSRGRLRVERGIPRDGIVAQLVTKERGLYRVSYEEIFGPEAPRGRRRIPVSSLRLSRQGESVVFHVEPESLGFGPGSWLYFLSEGSSLNAYGDAVYELEAGADGIRMRVEALSPISGMATRYLQDVVREENVYYQAGLLDAPDLWLWDVVVSPGSRSYTFTVDQLATAPGRLSVDLQGGSDFEGVVDHHVRARVNGTFVGETTWDGKQPKSLDLELEADVLNEGTNQLELEDVGDTGAAYSMVFLNRFRVSYPRRLEAIGGTLEGRFDETGEAQIAGLGGSVVALDTTGGVARWLTGATAGPGGLSLPVRQGMSYFLTSTFLHPEVRPVQGVALRSTTNRADYLLVAPEAFLSAAQPLLALRESQGLATKAVSLEDVYAQFGHGEAGPEGIKEFLEYAYHSWAAPSVRYVVLLGDASYDPKDYLGTGVKDWLPGFPVRTSYLWTVSDPSYAAVNGEDLIPDIAIGRLPAGNVDEALRLVQKITSYENGGGMLDGLAVLVADNADLGGNFEADANEIASGVLASRTPKRIYYSQYGASTRAKIEEAFDSGVSLMSYVGHGATAVWASENIFNYQDVKALAPQGQQPFLLTMNCLNGFFHFPPLNSLSEELLKAEGKGVIGAFSPSGLSVNEAAHVYHKALLEEMVSGRHSRIGDAILAAQERYAQSGALPELLAVYNLLGDPALTVR